MQYNDRSGKDSVDQETACDLWPDLVIEFLERNINFGQLPRSVQFIEDPVESENVNGDPIRIHCMFNNIIIE